MSFGKSDFLCGLESFITKSLQDRKSYKQIIHICTVCSNRQARRRRAVGEMGFGRLCVDVVMYVYRRIYFCFLIYWGNGGYLCSVLLASAFWVYHISCIILLSPPYMTFLTKSFFSFFLFCFLIKNDFLIRNKIKKHIS